MDEKTIRHCGNGWAYCDGDCKNCDANNFCISNRTESGFRQYTNRTATDAITGV